MKRHPFWMSKTKRGRTTNQPAAARVMNLLTTQASTELKDPRALQLLAKSLYQELRASGLGEREVMALAGELLDLVTASEGSPARNAG